MGNLSYTDSYYFLWGRATCPHCVLAANFFVEKALPHITHFLDDRPEILEGLQQRFKWPTVPLILEYRLDGSQYFIGGREALVKYIAQQEAKGGPSQ